MADPKFVQERTVLIFDLPENAKVDIINFEKTIRAAVKYYRDVYGIPKRIWVNAKDTPDEVETIDGMALERRGGCVRGKIMVM